MIKYKVSANFYNYEYACKGAECGHTAVINPVANELHELIRAKINDRTDFEFLMTFTSAFRCLVHNKKVGSNDHSQHPRATAVDFQDKFKRVPVITMYECVEEALKEMNIDGGVGIYNSFIHVDIRSKRARWDNRT